MKPIQKLLALFLACLMILSMTVPAAAADTEASLLRQMLNYFRYHQSAAATDIARLNAQLAEINPEQAAIWQKITDYWIWANSEMTVNDGILPDGLPEDDSLCIVVLGYALNHDGSMQGELIGRLKVALASAEKYPNAYILCTGGGTARNNASATEAGRMAAWLQEQGVDSSRIIAERDSKTTVQNAQFSCSILAAQYPQVQHLAMVSSSYHLYRGSTLFFAQSCLEGYGYDIVGTAGFDAGWPGPESSTLQSGDLARMAGVNIEGMDEPVLSKLVGIQVDYPISIALGSAPELTVTAAYDSGFSRIVTGSSFISGFDPELPGNQMMTLTYTENEITCSAEVQIEVLPPAAEAPTEATIRESGPAPVQNSEPELPSIIYPLAVLVLLLMLLLLLLKLRKKR